MVNGIGRTLGRLARLTGFAVGVSCASGPPGAMPPAASASSDEAMQAARRERMVAEQIVARGVRNPRVLAAMRAIARHRFVPADLVDAACDDSPLPIGEGQTISQPYIVAYMSEQLEVAPHHRVLEIGTGSGYQAAVLARLAAQVFSVEIDAGLAAAAAERFARLGIANVRTRVGDGFYGWPEEAPFDAIVVTAATPRLPELLLEQLGAGGRIVAPVGGDGMQTLVVGRMTDAGLVERATLPVVFVPMTGAVRAGGR